MFQAVNMFQQCFSRNKLRDLLNEYIKRNVLDEYTLWKNYLEDHCNLAIFDIRKNNDLHLWVFIDKNASVISCIANLTDRKLCEIERKQSYLLLLLLNEQLTEIKHANIYV